jgi:hypothetical protein
VLVLACLAVSRVCSVEAGKLLAGWMKPATAQLCSLTLTGWLDMPDREFGVVIDVKVSARTDMDLKPKMRERTGHLSEKRSAEGIPRWYGIRDRWRVLCMEHC